MTDLEKLKCIKIAVTLGVLCLIFQQGWCVYEAYTKNIRSKDRLDWLYQD